MRFSSGARALIFLLATIAIPFAALEIWTRAALFDSVSYTNSVTLDRTWQAVEHDSGWNVLMLGNSEVRWGFSTDALDATLADNGLFSYSLNFAVDGLGLNESLLLLPRLELEKRLPDLRVAIIGVQLADAHASSRSAEKDGIACESALMRPVFTSPWARDHDLSSLCRDAEPSPAIVNLFEDFSAVARYRSQLRAALLQTVGVEHKGLGLDSSALAMAGDGYHPHVPISVARENHDQAVANLLREKAANPRDFEPLPPDRWPTLVEPGDLFDTWAAFFESRGVVPVFVALPTNPQRIDIASRREDYHRNSALLQDWASRTGRVFVDLGLPTYDDSELLYADHRHLSFVGASRYTSRLAAALASEPRIRAALAVRDMDLLSGKPTIRLPATVFEAGKIGEFNSIQSGVARPLNGREGPAVLLTSTATSLAPAGDGNTTKISLPPIFTEIATGKQVAVTLRARRPKARGSAEMRVMYSRPGVSADGWKTVKLSEGWQDHRLVFAGPATAEGAASYDLIGVWADPTGRGDGVEISQVTVDIIGR